MADVSKADRSENVDLSVKNLKLGIGFLKLHANNLLLGM